MRIATGILCGALGRVASYNHGGNFPRPAIEPVVFLDAPLRFSARLDIGATISSIKARDIEVVVGFGSFTRGEVAEIHAAFVTSTRGSGFRLQ